MALTDEDRAEIAGLIDAGCGELMNKSLAGITDTLKKVSDACASMSERMDGMDQARRDTGDIDQRIGDLAKRVAADRAKSTEDADDLKDMDMGAVRDRADAICGLFGEQAPPPWAGETVTSFRRRMATHFKRYCKEFSGVDLATIKAPEAFKAAEDVIYAAADSVGRSAPVVAPGRLLMREKKVDGHIHREFWSATGPSVWMDQFAGSSGLKAVGEWKISGLGNRGN